MKYAKRQFIHIYIDNSTYLKLKSSGKNMSDLGNQLFTAYFANEKLASNEETEIIAELEELTKKLDATQERINLLSVQLVHARQIQEEKEIKDQQEGEAEMKALRMNNPLRWASLGGRKS